MLAIQALEELLDFVTDYPHPQEVEGWDELVADCYDAIDEHYSNEKSPQYGLS